MEEQHGNSLLGALLELSHSIQGAVLAKHLQKPLLMMMLKRLSRRSTTDLCRKKDSSTEKNKYNRRWIEELEAIKEQTCPR